MIVVEIPGEDDPQKASEYIGKTAKLQFVTEDGQLVMEGNDIVSAKHAYEQTSDIGGYGHVVNLTITSDAQQRFYGKLKGVTDPEKKRKIIGEEFIRVFEEEAKSLSLEAVEVQVVINIFSISKPLIKQLYASLTNA